MSRIRSTWMACATAVVGLLAAAPAAQAAFGLQGLSAAPTDLGAGHHSNLPIHIGFTGNEDVKDLTIHLPPGLVGNPTVAPQCTPAQLNADNCPQNSEVGTVSSDVTITVVAVPVPLTVNGNLYNLTPQPGEPARFGIVLRPVSLPPPLPSVLPNVILQSGAKLRPSDFGLDTIIKDIPNTSSGLPTHINSMDVTLDGMVNGKGFMRNPTSCTAKTVTFDATSYGSTQANGSAPSFTPTNCGALPFSPTLRAQIGAPGATAEGSNTPVTAIIEQNDDEAGLRNAEVLLPSAIAANVAVLDHGCDLSQFQADPAACPATSVLGSARATSPLLASALTGPVVLIQGSPFPQLGVDLQGPLSLQLVGSFVLTPQGNSFENLPDIPIGHFELRFHGGPGALISAATDLCQAPKPLFHASFDGWNGAHQEGDAAANVEGCGSGGTQRKPRASVKLAAARSKHPRMRLRVHAGSAPVRKATLKLPPKLRFGHGKAARRHLSATDDSGKLPRSAIHVKGRRVKVSAAVQGTRSLVLRAGRGALRRAKRIAPGAKLRFPISVRDVDGRSTSLVASARAGH